MTKPYKALRWKFGLNGFKNRFTAFPSSGEINFVIEDAASEIASIVDTYQAKAIGEKDGVSLAFGGWCFNLRKFNT